MIELIKKRSRYRPPRRNMEIIHSVLVETWEIQHNQRIMLQGRQEIFKKLLRLYRLYSACKRFAYLRQKHRRCCCG
jgi:hypothetical protein